MSSLCEMTMNLFQKVLKITLGDSTEGKPELASVSPLEKKEMELGYKQPFLQGRTGGAEQ